MGIQALFEKQEERFSLSDLIARRISQNEWVLVYSSDEELCQVVGQAAMRPCPVPLHCPETQRSYGILIAPSRWNMLCRFIQELPDNWKFEEPMEEAHFPPNVENIAFLRAFIHQEVLFRRKLADEVSSRQYSSSEDIAARMKLSRRAKIPFWIPEVGGSKWPHYKFIFTNNTSADLPIET